MKFHLWLLVSFFMSIIAAAQWSSEDYEIFQLNDLIRKDIGPETTFYSWLGLSSKASQNEIKKAYRKLSLKIHPDKVASTNRKLKKLAEERYQRLSAVGNILRDHSLKKRYDFFLSKGFPQLKGSNYVYSKFRPGIVLTLAFLFILVSIFHYVSLAIGRSQDRKRIQELKEQIKLQAWGGSMIPPTDGSARRISQQGSENTFIVQPNGDIFLEEGESHSLLDENDIHSPHWRELVLFKLPAGLYNVTIGNLIGKKIDTNYIPPVKDSNPDNIEQEASDQKSKKKKSKQRGRKVELPNGKVIYQRPGR